MLCSRCNRYYLNSDVLAHILDHVGAAVTTSFSDAQAVLDSLTAQGTDALPRLQALNGTLDFTGVLGVFAQICAIAPAPVPASVVDEPVS